MHLQKKGSDGHVLITLYFAKTVHYVVPDNGCFANIVHHIVADTGCYQLLSTGLCPGLPWLGTAGCVDLSWMFTESRKTVTIFCRTRLLMFHGCSQKSENPYVGFGFGVWWFGGYGVCGRWPSNRPEKSTKIGGKKCAPTWASTQPMG